MTKYDPTHIAVQDDRGCWKRLPRDGWAQLAEVLREEAAKWEADGFCMWSKPGEPEAFRAYADRIDAALAG